MVFSSGEKLDPRIDTVFINASMEYSMCCSAQPMKRRKNRVMPIIGLNFIMVFSLF